jgi:hypothetical protein
MKMTTIKSSRNRRSEIRRQNRRHPSVTMKYCLQNATRTPAVEAGATGVAAEAIKVGSLAIQLLRCSRRMPKRGRLMRLAQRQVAVHLLLLIIFKRIHNYTNKMTSGLKSMPLKHSMK